MHADVDLAGRPRWDGQPGRLEVHYLTATDQATAVVATSTAVVRATAEAAKPSGARKAKVAAGNLGVAARLRVT